MSWRPLHAFKFWLKRDYKRNKFNISLSAWTAALAHPAYYFVCTELLKGYKDSPEFRFGSALLSVPLLFQLQVSKSSLVWINLYWYFWITFILPISFTFLLLLNNFAPMWVVCQMFMLSLTIILIGNLVRIVLIICAGTIIGFYCFQYLSNQSIGWTQLITSKPYPLWHLLVPLPIAFWGGVIFFYGAKQAVINIERTKAISVFAGSIAHEKRNSFSQIKFALDNIYALCTPPGTDGNIHDIPISTDDKNTFYHNIAIGMNACDRGMQMIDLTLSQVNNHPPNSGTFQYMSAAGISVRAVNEYGFESDDERTRVHLHIKKDFVIYIDETAYIHIIFNILKNAVYYFRTHPDAVINIEINQPRITITDTGPGISTQMRNKLFNAFSTDGKETGSGLGLSFCDRTMQTFNGQISCHSKVNQYTTFTLNFPKVTTEKINLWMAKMIEKIKQLLVNRRILLVDDEDIYLRVLSHLLVFLNCEIDTANSGQATIDMLRKKTYDLIFMDLQMPNKDGYSTCREIRDGVVPDQRNICIIAHTNEPQLAAKLKTEKVGMDGFLSKPCTQLELVKEINRAQELAEQRTFLAQAGDGLKGKTVLIADDESFNRRILSVYAKQWYMQVIEADSGEAALEILEQAPDIDIIFMDIHMLTMSGLEASKKIRANPELREIIIIGISGEFSDEATASMKAAGMDDSIVKPVEPDVLKKKLLQLVQAKPRAKPDPARKRRTKASLAANKKISPTQADNKLPELADIDGKLPFTNQQISWVSDLKLLDDARLTEYQQSFKDDFPGFLEEIIINMQTRDQELQAAFTEKNYPTVHGTLHSLIGISGYAGTFALNQYIKLQVYPRINEQNFASEDHWVKTIHRLVEQSKVALRREWS